MFYILYECLTDTFLVGMTSSIQYFTFDGSVSSAFVHNGSIPETKFNNGDITLYLCVYQPMGCGKKRFEIFLLFKHTCVGA